MVKEGCLDAGHGAQENPLFVTLPDALWKLCWNTLSLSQWRIR
ncbi:hypothetical protein BN133_511 [Cronobacter dublinensis 582]|nr:hypothetical protein BN133_511 [Cronobacter dublinensis 582]